MLFQILVLRQPIESVITLCLGLVAVIVGLAVFMEGLSTGLMPFGTIIGDNLPKKASMTVVLIIIGILGVGVTFAEPAIGALQAFGASVNVRKAPYLYELLNNWPLPLVIIVGAGVGVAAILGTIFLYFKQPIVIAYIVIGFFNCIPIALKLIDGKGLK